MGGPNKEKKPFLFALSFFSAVQKTIFTLKIFCCFPSLSLAKVSEQNESNQHKCRNKRHMTKILQVSAKWKLSAQIPHTKEKIAGLRAKKKKSCQYKRQKQITHMYKKKLSSLRANESCQHKHKQLTHKRKIASFRAKWQVPAEMSKAIDTHENLQVLEQNESCQHKCQKTIDTHKKKIVSFRAEWCCMLGFCSSVRSIIIRMPKNTFVLVYWDRACMQYVLSCQDPGVKWCCSEECWKSSDVASWV